MNFKLFITFFLVLYSVGCAPSFSEFQTADLSGRGSVEVTPYFSSTTGNFDSDDMDGEDDGFVDLQSSFGFRAAYGYTDKVDITFDYEAITAEGDLLKGTGTSIGFKFSLLNRDEFKLSTHIPYSIYRQEIDGLSLDGSGDAASNDFKALEPTLLSSYRLSDNLSLNSSFKIIYPLEEDEVESVPQAINFSASYTLPFYDQLTLIPEYGMFYDEGEHTYTHFGVGCRFRFSSK